MDKKASHIKTWFDLARRCIVLSKKLFDSGTKPLDILVDAAKKDRFAKIFWLICMAALTAAFLYSLNVPLRYVFVVIALAVALLGLPTLKAPADAPKWIATFVNLAVPVARAIIVVLLMMKLAILVWNSQRPPAPLATINVDASSKDWFSAGCEREVGTRIKPAHGRQLIRLPPAKCGQVRWCFEGDDVPKNASVAIRILGPSRSAEDDVREIADGEITEYPSQVETWLVESIDGGDKSFRLVAYHVH